jgi:hypothetical protein
MGTKLTCAGIGKGTRIAAHVQSKEYLARHGPFQVLPGFTDYLLPALVSGHTGCITGTGNVIPKSIVKLYNLSTKAIETGDPKLFKEALELQQIGERLSLPFVPTFDLMRFSSQSPGPIGALSRLASAVLSTRWTHMWRRASVERREYRYQRLTTQSRRW